jgi:hypothetical protein
MEQNVVTPGQIEIVMGGDFNNPLASTEILAYVDFTVDASTAPNATSVLSLTCADLNEGQVSSTAVDGVFTVVRLLYGDVTGNGTLGGYDASWVLEHVANGLLDPPVDVTFPIENTAPVWAALPLTDEDADAVAEVDTADGGIAPTTRLSFCRGPSVSSRASQLKERQPRVSTRRPLNRC